MSVRSENEVKSDLYRFVSWLVGWCNENEAEIDRCAAFVLRWTFIVLILLLLKIFAFLYLAL